MKRFNFIRLLNSVLSSFRRIELISDPRLTARNWCVEQPCMKIHFLSREIILTQPSSTLFVYFLGVLTIGVGIYFLSIQGSEVSRLWWGVSLLLWGIGALLAGTSYQALAYEIKCAARQSCAWTSWWEVVYLILQQCSVSAMLVGVAYSSTTGSLQTILLAYALVSASAYIIIALVGGFVPIKSLITFNLMVRLSIPAFVIVFILSGWRYFALGTSMDLVLLGTWLLLLFTSAAYYLYDQFDITEKLWANGTGFWFSQNDVLHIGLILWMTYIATVVADRIRDYSQLIVPG